MTDPFAGDRTTRVRLVRSDGEELVMGDGLPWVIEYDGLDGFAKLDLGVSTSQNVLTDGSSLVSKRVNETDREVKATYIGPDRPGARARAVAFFNPRFSFAMHATVGNRTRWCEGELSGFDCPARSPRLPVALTFTLTCLDPFWRSEDHNDFAFGDATPMLGWPYVSHVRMVGPRGERHPVGNPVSVLIYDGRNTLVNAGDVEAAYTIRVLADGELVNPTVTKDGKLIKVLVTMQRGDLLLVDYESRRLPQVTLNGENVIQKCSRDSSFTGMMIQPGANVFTFTIDNTANRLLADVRVLYYKRYLGV